MYAYLLYTISTYIFKSGCFVWYSHSVKYLSFDCITNLWSLQLLLSFIMACACSICAHTINAHFLNLLVVIDDRILVSRNLISSTRLFTVIDLNENYLYILYWIHKFHFTVFIILVLFFLMSQLNYRIEIFLDNTGINRSLSIKRENEVKYFWAFPLIILFDTLFV